MNKQLLFIGTNLNLALFTETAERQGYTVAGILDDNYFGNTPELHGLPIVDTELCLADPERVQEMSQKYEFFIATNWGPDPGHVQDTLKRARQIALVEQAGIKCINLIDPTAQVSPSAKLGHGIYIGTMAYIEPHVEIADFCQVYYGVGIAHASRLGKNTVIQRQAGITGIIGDDCYIGMWVKIYKPGYAKIGNNVTVNPGLYVARDVDPGEYIKLNKDSVRVYQYLIQTV